MEDKLKILLCEDDENLGMLLREYLAAKGYEAELCPDGEAGFKAFLKTKFDICQCRNTHHLPHGQDAEGRHSGGLQAGGRRLHHEALFHGRTRVPYRGHLA